MKKEDIDTGLVDIEYLMRSLAICHSPSSNSASPILTRTRLHGHRRNYPLIERKRPPQFTKFGWNDLQDIRPGDWYGCVVTESLLPVLKARSQELP